MRVIVTGAAGRLGRSVVDILQERGHDVVPVDRTEYRGGYVVELTDEARTREVFAEIAPDAVVHLAAIAVPFSAPERQIFTVNTTMAFTVLDAAIAAGATRILAASSPTVFGYGPADWLPDRLPLDEAIPPRPTHAYSLSKLVIEETVATFARSNGAVRLASFRPCYVVAPEEWSGAPTQQGHGILDRLRDPALAATALFNYIDARDVGDFIDAWLAADDAPSGAVYMVGAADALAVRPLDELLPKYHPALATLSTALVGTRPAFDTTSALHDVGWQARRSWRTELPSDVVAELTGVPLTGTEVPVDERIAP